MNFTELDRSLSIIREAWKSDKKSHTPKIIHQIWVNESPFIPQEWNSSPIEWKRLHPDWHHVLWNGDMSRELVQKYHPELLTTYDNFPHEIQRIDTARYVFLQAYGGLYADLDTVPMVNIESHINCDSPVWLVNDVEKETYTNCLMLSKPGISFWNEVIAEVIIRSKKKYIGKFNTVLETTGSRMITAVIGKHTDTICRLPNAKFNAFGSEGATVSATLEKGAIIQNLRGLSWLATIRSGANKMKSTLPPGIDEKNNSTKWWLLFILVILVISFALWYYGVTLSSCIKFFTPSDIKMKVDNI